MKSWWPLGVSSREPLVLSLNMKPCCDNQPELMLVLVQRGTVLLGQRGTAWDSLGPGTPTERGDILQSRLSR